MKHKLPKRITNQYYGGARGFKIEKRQALREIENAFKRLRPGCAYFPAGSTKVNDLGVLLRALQRELSIKEWGR